MIAVGSGGGGAVKRLHFCFVYKFKLRTEIIDLYKHQAISNPFSSGVINLILLYLLIIWAGTEEKIFFKV